MRFWVNVTGVGGVNLLNTALNGTSPQAGFSTCSTPEATTEAVEYKEGHYVYTRKYPGNPTVSDISMQRGVAKVDSSFWSWLKTVIEGGEYRADVAINHYHRDTALPGLGAGKGNLQGIDLTAKPARQYLVKEAFPTRHKVAGDMDATASEVSIQDLDLAYEEFDVIESG